MPSDPSASVPNAAAAPLRTPLHEAHVAAGARLVDFAGWEMPLHYGSQIEEHHAVRRHAGMFDVSHMLAIDITGPDATPYLRRLLANDVARLAGKPGKALYSCMLRDDGGVIDDLIVYFFAPERYRMVVNAATADKDLAWMREQAAGLDLQIAPRRDLAMIAVQGPQARTLAWQALPALKETSAALAPFVGALDGERLIARTGYTGEDGFELTLPAGEAPAAWNALRAAGVAPCGLGARDTLRLEAGMNLYGQDMDETVTPLESGLAWTVAAADDREFVGKPALLTPRAPELRQLTGLLLPSRGVLRAHQAVRAAQGDGEITSGTFSPTLQMGIALARLPGSVAPGDAVSVDIRGKRCEALVVKPPFVRHGKALVSTSLKESP